MSEDRDPEREEEQERPSRPVTAAARRERRGSARPGAKATGDGPTTASREAAAGTGGTKGPGNTRPKPKTRGGDKAGEKAAADTSDKKGRPTPSRDTKEKRPSPLGRLTRFLREVVAELRKVIWPTRKQMITYTAVVLVFVAFMVAVIAGLDILLARGVLWLFG